MRHEKFIDDKCDDEGCDEKRRERHRHYYIFEAWDVHPPSDFAKWWLSQPASAACSGVTAWNCARDRDRFNRWKAGTPEPEEAKLTAEQAEVGNRFIAKYLAWQDRNKAPVPEYQK